MRRAGFKQRFAGIHLSQAKKSTNMNVIHKGETEEQIRIKIVSSNIFYISPLRKVESLNAHTFTPGSCPTQPHSSTGVY